MPRPARKKSGASPAPARKQPARPSSADAYESLLRAIEAGDLPPGARLREVELAGRFGISRTPVREALKRLEHQGLVAHEAHHGATVATLDYAQVTELYEMREVLEGTAARLAAIHATETEIALLADLVERDTALVADPQRLAHNNRVFHQQIRNAARNRFLIAMLETLRLSLALLGETTLAVGDRGATSVAEHRAIVARIAAHDPDGAEAEARAHIRAAFRTRILLNQAEMRPSP